MPAIVLLDTGPLGLVSHPRKNHEAKEWLRKLLQARTLVIVPEIADYELRRELILYNRRASIARLDHFKVVLEYAPITTEVWLLAADLWADARRHGSPTAAGAALDGDVLLAALARVVARRDSDTVIATTNVSHLERYAPARPWQEIQ